MTLHIYPQDEGTGAVEGDWIDAASVAQLAHNPNDVDYIVSGFEISNIVHGDTATVDVGAGVAKLYKEQMATSEHADQLPEARSETTMVVEEDTGFTEVGIADGLLNHIFLQVSFSSNDSASIITNTSGDEPAGLTLKIGVVDMTTDTITYVNQRPDAEFENLSTDTAYLGQLSSQPADADIPDGSTALYTKTDGGLYKRESGGTETQVGLTNEEVQDIIGSAVGDGLNYDDTNNTISGITDEEVQDVIGSIVQRGLYYDDNNNVIRGRSAEEIQDIIGDIAGSGLNYDDTNNLLEGKSDASVVNSVIDALGYGLESSDGDTIEYDTESGPYPYERITTFGEQNVSISHQDTVVEGGDIRITGGYNLSEVTLEESVDTSTFTDANWRGVYPQTMLFFNSGNRLLLEDMETYQILEFSLDDAYSVAGMTHEATYDQGNFGPTFLYDIKFSGDGSKFYIAGDSSYYQYSLSTPYDLSTLSLESTHFDYSTASALEFSDDGTTVVLAARNSDNYLLNTYTLSTPWDLSTMSHQNEEQVSGSEAYLWGSLQFLKDGEVLLAGYNSAVHKYTLSTPYQPSTRTHQTTFNPNTGGRYFRVTEDGRNLFVSGTDDQILNYYTLAGPSSGSATIELDAPDDVSEWLGADYSASPDGETVNVYIEYNDGSGWSRANSGNPISKHYSLATDSAISASGDVRFGLELSRNDHSNNPRLNSVARSWQVYSSDTTRSNEEIQDAVGSIVQNGISYDDNNNLIEGRSQEEIQDIIGNIVTDGISYDDGNNLIQGRTEEEVQDVIGNIVQNGLTYDDNNNIIEGRSEEEIQDIIGGIAGEGLTYDDVNNLLKGNFEEGEVISTVVDALGHGLTADDGQTIETDTETGHSQYERVETFKESKVSVSHNDTVTAGDSIRISDGWNFNQLQLQDTADTSNFTQASDDGVQPRGVAFSGDGKTMLLGDYGSDYCMEFSLDAPYDITTMSHAATHTITDYLPGDTFIFAGDGQYLYVSYGSYHDNSVAKYTMSTPYDFSTRTRNGGINLGVGSVTCLTFSNDGTKAYGTDNGIETDDVSIFEWDVSTPYDLSTASLANSISPSPLYDVTPDGIEINDDGTQVIVIEYDTVHIFELSTAYDIGTASQTGTSTLSGGWVADSFLSDSGDVLIGTRESQAEIVKYHVGGGTSGSATIEIDNPSEVGEWLGADYTAIEDGETVDVYVARNDGSGWSRANGGNTISANYSLNADSDIAPSDRIRFEVELSRSNTLNYPKLESLYRSWNKTEEGSRLEAQDSDGTQIADKLSGLLSGDNVSFTPNDDGTVTISSTDTDTDTHVTVRDSDGNVVVEDAQYLDGGDKIVLQSDSDGVVSINSTAPDADTHVDLLNSDGSTVISNPESLIAGENIDFTNNNDGTATASATGSTDSTQSTRKITRDDYTETFSESHVSLTTSNAVVNNGNLEVGSGEIDTFNLKQYHGGLGNSSEEPRGIVINPNTEINYIEVSGIWEYYPINDGEIIIRDLSTGTDIKTYNVTSTLDSTRIDVSMMPGTDYAIISTATGGFAYTRASDWPSPLESGIFDVVEGISPQSGGRTGELWAFSAITANTLSSGTATVSMNKDNYLHAWDTIAFQGDEGNGSLKINILDGNGNIIKEGISRYEDISDIDPSINIQFEVNLNVADTGAPPVLNSLYRQYIV